MSEPTTNDSDRDEIPENDSSSNEGQSDTSDQSGLNIHIPNIPLANKESRPTLKRRPRRQRPSRGGGRASGEEHGGELNATPTPAEPVAPQPRSSANSARNIAAQGFLIGIGGTGTSVVDLAIWSDHFKTQTASDRRRSFETLIPEKLQVLNFDLSRELNEKYRDNPGVAGYGAEYTTIMDFSLGAGKVPAIGRFVGELQYEYLVRQFKNVAGQVALIAHSHTGGTGSGLAPTVAMLLTADEADAAEYQLPDNVNKNRTLRNQRSSEVVSDAISIGITQRDRWPENRIYNFKNIVESFSLSIIIDVDTITGDSKNSFTNLEHGVADQRPNRKDTLAFYRTNTVLPSFGDRTIPQYLEIGDNEGLKHAVADRYAARIIRMLGSYVTERNIRDLLNASRKGKRFSNSKGPAKWALPYVWPPDGDMDPEITDRSLGYAVTRALLDGGLCAAGSEFKSAESVIVLYESHSEFLKTADHQAASAAIEMLFGIDRQNVTIERVKSLKEFDSEGLSVVVLAVGQVPGFAEEWLETYQDTEKQEELKRTVSTVWLAGGAFQDDEKPLDDIEESTDVLPDVLQKGQWRSIRDALERHLQPQLGISPRRSRQGTGDDVSTSDANSDGQAGEDSQASTHDDNISEGQQVLRKYITDKMVALHDELEVMDVWADFKRFADETGITRYVDKNKAT